MDTASDNDSFGELLEPKLEPLEPLSPLDIEEEEDIPATTWNSLPEASRKKYEGAYKLYIEWVKALGQDTKPYSEDALMTYFSNISTRFKSSTLWTQYSMLRRTLSISYDVDIAKHSKLRAFLKRQSHGYQPKKTKTFTSQDINKFIREAPDHIYLLSKVALIMGVRGACRRHELYQLRTSDLSDLQSAVIVTVRNKNSKVIRTFTITGVFYEIYKKYADLRPAAVAHDYFFIGYQKGKCSTQKTGINKFGTLGKEIAAFLKLPNPGMYTGHCFYRSCGAVADDEGDEMFLKKYAGFKPTPNPKYTPIAMKRDLEFVAVQPISSVESVPITLNGDNLTFADVKSTPMTVNWDNSQKPTPSVESTPRTINWENRNNLTFELSSANSPTLVFNNCSNITFNIVNKKGGEYL